MRGKARDKVPQIHKKKKEFDHDVQPADKKDPIDQPSKIFVGMKRSPRKKRAKNNRQKYKK